MEGHTGKPRGPSGGRGNEEKTGTRALLVVCVQINR